MTSWQKRTRAVLALIALGVIGAVGYTLRPREARVAPAAVEKLPDKVTVVTTGGDAIQLKGSSQDLRIEFERQESYESGQTKFFGVRINVDNRGGRNYTITGKEMVIGKDQSSFDVSGDVKLETSDGLTAYGQSASYTDTEKIVKVPGPVKFARGRMSGTGVGFTYDEQRDTIWMLDQAVVHFAADGAAPAADLTAGAFGFARRDRYMRLERTMHMEREGQITDANEATVTLFPDRDESDYIELRGNARIAGGAGMGLLKSLSATDMNLDYREDGRSLQQATLAGQADIQLATKTASAGQRMQADNMDIVLAPDGSVSNLSARDRVEVSLPATAETAARTIKSNALTAAGGAQGLNTMKFSEGVSYDEAATKTQGARTARSRSLDAALDPAAGTLKEATFTSSFVFEDGGMRATSGKATYRIAAGQLELTEKEGTAVPQIKDETLTIDADRIDVTLSPRKMIAAGKVQSVLQPSKKPAGNAQAAKRPGLLQDKDPVNVIADKLTYDEASRKGEYTGTGAVVPGRNADQRRRDHARRNQGRPDRHRQGDHHAADRREERQAGRAADADGGARRVVHLHRSSAPRGLQDAGDAGQQPEQLARRHDRAVSRAGREHARTARGRRRRHRQRRQARRHRHEAVVPSGRRQVRGVGRARQDDRCRLPGDDRQDVDLLQVVR